MNERLNFESRPITCGEIGNIKGNKVEVTSASDEPIDLIASQITFSLHDAHAKNAPFAPKYL